MSGWASRLLRQGSLYAVANLTMKGAGFLLALIYLNPAYLSQEAFGIWGTLDAAAKVIVPLLGLGLVTGVLRFWADPELEDQREALATTALAATIGLALIGGAVMLVGAEWIAAGLLGDEAPPGAAHLVRLLGALVAFRTVTAVPQSLLRIRERPGVFVVAVGGEMVVLVAGTVYLLVVRGMGLEGVVLAHVAAAGLSALVLTAGALWTGRAAIRPDLLGKLVRFGLPLAAAGVASLLLNLGDRFLLLRITDAATTAVYDWSGRLGSLLYLVVISSFNLAFSVLGVKSLKGDATQTALHQSVFRHFIVITGFLALGLSLIAFDLTRWISPEPAYLGAETLVAPIAAGYLLYGVYFLMVNVLFVADRTRTVAVLLVGATALNVALNVALIPTLGPMGAALATVVSYGALVAFTARTVAREAATRFDWSILAKVLGLGAVLWGLGHVSVDWSLAARIGWRALAVALYVPGAVALGLYRWAEIREGLARVRAWRRRR